MGTLVQSVHNCIYGTSFNITSGLDSNGDGIFTERPTFGVLQNRCSELGLTASYCSIGSNDPNAIIPRNWGQSPSYFSVNLRVGKTIGFGKSAGSQTAANGAANGGQAPVGFGGGRGPGGGGRGGRGGGGGRAGVPERAAIRENLTI